MKKSVILSTNEDVLLNISEANQQKTMRNQN